MSEKSNVKPNENFHLINIQLTELHFGQLSEIKKEFVSMPLFKELDIKSGKFSTLLGFTDPKKGKFFDHVACYDENNFILDVDFIASYSIKELSLVVGIRENMLVELTNSSNMSMSDIKEAITDQFDLFLLPLYAKLNTLISILGNESCQIGVIPKLDKIMSKTAKPVIKFPSEMKS